MAETSWWFRRWLRNRVRFTLRIAKWEVTKNAGGVDTRTILIAVISMVGMAAVGGVAATQGIALDEGIYRVGVSEESPYYEPARLDPTFTVEDPDSEALAAGRQDVMIENGRIRWAQTQKGRAAAAELRSTVKQYNDFVMDNQANESAAFPVLVNLSYREQAVDRVIAPEQSDGGTQQIDTTEGDGADGGDGDGTDGTDGSTSDGTDGGATDGGATDGTDGGTTDGGATDGTDGDAADGTDSGTTDGTDGGSDGDATDGTDSGTTTGGADNNDDETDATATDGDSGVGGSSFTARLTGDSVSGRPSDIAPPFPFRSLVLAFIFVLPLNFIIQAYGSTMLSERLNRRGELLLVAPISRADIIVGKTLPYFSGAIGIAALITVALDGSAVSVLAIVPLALLFLSSTFLGAMFARSFKELTFVTVTVTVSLTSYAFVPAIFTDVTPIALISPLTLVVRDMQGQAIDLGQFTFSTLPPTLTALVLFGLGAGLYREEDMFTQRPIPLKVLDALAGRIRGKYSVAKMSALLLPFVFVAELVAIAMLFALGELSILLILVCVAVIEEIAKSLHIYAGYEHARFDTRFRGALVLGALSGFGFFVAEKATTIIQLAGLGDLEIGQAAFNTAGVVEGPLLIAFLLAPLALHVVTTTVSAIGARRSHWAYAFGLSVAIVIHTAYNLTVVIFLGPA
jgi:ABC-type Na+ efflux pump permease subunit